MQQRFPVTLTAAQRDQLQHLIFAGTAPARKLTHARILLKAERRPGGPAWTDDAIADAMEVSQPTVARVRRQFVDEGLEAALNRRAPRREYRRKLDGEQEARLVALACGQPPDGRAHWTLQLLADKLVELEIVAAPISSQTVRRTLKKTNSSPG